jgi:hypothetical protein
MQMAIHHWGAGAMIIMDGSESEYSSTIRSAKL